MANQAPMCADPRPFRAPVCGPVANQAPVADSVGQSGAPVYDPRATIRPSKREFRGHLSPSVRTRGPIRPPVCGPVANQAPAANQAPVCGPAANQAPASESWNEYKCVLVDSCLGTASGAPGLGYLDTSESTECAEGTSGVLCAVCGETERYFLNGDSCVECASPAEALVVCLFVVLAITAGIISMFYVDAAQHTAIYKIIVRFLQVMHLYIAYIDINWPSLFTMYFKYTAIANLALFSITPVSCISEKIKADFYSQHIFSSLTIPLAALLFEVIYWVYVLKLTFYVGNERAFRRKALHFKKKCFSNALWIIVMAYPGVVSTLFALYRCAEIKDERYLIADYSLLCSGTKYNRFMSFGNLGVALFVIGSPVALVLILWLTRYAEAERAKFHMQARVRSSSRSAAERLAAPALPHSALASLDRLRPFPLPGRTQAPHPHIGGDGYLYLPISSWEEEGEGWSVYVCLVISLDSAALRCALLLGHV
ncbi:hypothetical protein CYMTET_28244 [Cymbomonas tetramitiformis]|uniref:Uncharacterized protein n=1 Tax=Cymbomonas tetramitiformis TaxID=36881 RepID=A0AAE0FNI0_9CHLO|nr:hypothetical protein CYMTET_28244 [Cymbomonas tetramitiformis]